MVLAAGDGPILAAAFLPLVFAAVSHTSAVVTSLEVEVRLESVVFSGADLNEALVRVSFLFVSLLGAGSLSGFAGADSLGGDLVWVVLSLSFVTCLAGVVLGAEGGLAGVFLVAEGGLVGVVCVLACETREQRTSIRTTD